MDATHCIDLAHVYSRFVGCRLDGYFRALMQLGNSEARILARICDSPPTLVRRCCRLSILKINDYFVPIGGHNERLLL